MRIIGGNLRGKKILSPTDKSTRPLKDIVRESIFNIIEHSKNEFVNLNSAKVLKARVRSQNLDYLKKKKNN